MLSLNTNFPEHYRQDLIIVCVNKNIFSQDRLIIQLKRGMHLSVITGSNKTQYNQLLQALPKKIQKEYLDGTINLRKYHTIDYAFNKKDQEVYFVYLMPNDLYKVLVEVGLESFEKFVSFISKGGRLNNLPGAKQNTETDLYSFMPEHIRGWYKRLHLLKMQQRFSSVSKKNDCLDSAYLAPLSVRARNMAIGHGIFNEKHFKLAFEQQINFKKIRGFGKGIAEEFRSIL